MSNFWVNHPVYSCVKLLKHNVQYIYIKNVTYDKVAQSFRIGLFFVNIKADLGLIICRKSGKTQLNPSHFYLMLTEVIYIRTSCLNMSINHNNFTRNNINNNKIY